MNRGPVAGSLPPLPAAAENPAYRTWTRLWPLVLAVILLAISAVARFSFRDVVTSDLDFYVLRWYAKFQELGIGTGLGKDFYNYSPPYMYLLALSTLTSRWFPAVIAVKLISTVFDAYTAFIVYKIVRLKFQQGYLPLLAGSAFFCAPTVVTNTAIWGQADSSYTSFLLTSVYFLLVDNPLVSVLFFSIAFAVKPQAIFLAPLLVILVLWKKIPWYYSFLVPVIYALAALPAVYLGRTWLEVLSIYLSRPASGKALTHNAASLYVFMPRSALGFLEGPGVLLGGAAILLWLVASSRPGQRADRPGILLLALVSAALTPFVLPNMHDRYYYPADAISIVLGFTLPELWFIPILFQLSSGLAYSVYLSAAPPDNLEAAAILNMCALVVLIIKQFTIGSKAVKAPSPLAHAD